MSIGNLRDQGNKGNNFPYQLRTLQLLSSINEGISALPGIDYETRTSTYQANTNGAGYSTGNIIIRYDIIDVATSSLTAVMWFNETTQADITAPLPADLIPVNAPSGVTVLNGPNVNAVNIQDGGNSITVDATALDIRTLTFATDSVDVSGSNINAVVTATALDIRALLYTYDSITAYQGGGAWDVSGSSVSVSNFPATQNVNITSTIALPITDNGGSITVDGGTGVQRTPNLSRVSGVSGTIPAGAYSISFISTGTANATVNGTALHPGEFVDMDPKGINNTLPAVTYGTLTPGAELLILVIN